MDNLKQPIKDLKINSLDIDTIFKFCPDGIVYKDKNLRYVESNESYNKTFALKHFNSLVGKKENPYITKNIMKLINDADKEVMKSNNPITYVINVSEKTLLNVTTFPVIDKNSFQGIISIIKDITQEEAIKEDFVNKYYEYINTERKLQSQRETFVASLGHDLKNPTIAQIRSLELLLKGCFGEFTEAQKEILEMVLDSCRYMHGMLASMLATYRDCGGTITLKFEEFSLLDLVNECVTEMIYVAKDKGVNILIKDFANTIMVQADKVQIKRVIMNLLSNGIKYAFSNSDLKLKIFNSEIFIGFEFENKSPYITEENRKNIFGQYVSFASTYNELGIGLGLYASKCIINGHCGKIYVKSFEDNRNIFGFKIPLSQEDCAIKSINF
jgi:K+-sensing histidine kinase KdpD